MSTDQFDIVREKLPYVTVELDGLLRWDTGDTTTKEQWGPYCDLRADVRELGFELEDGGYDHDTIWGQLRRIA